MKKIYSFIALLLLFCVTTAQAQRRWAIADESAKEILAGEDHSYVIREGFNTGGWSHSHYLNSSSDDCIENVDLSCIYSFIEVDEKVDNGVSYPVYILKNHANNKYLSDGDDLYVGSPARAFRFTARKAKERGGEGDDYHNDAAEWFDYSNACEAARSGGAEAAGAWIFCSTEYHGYIGFIDNPSFTSYYDTNNWLVLEATEEKVSAFEKLEIIFDQYYKYEVSPENYPVGSTPGCVSQDLYDTMKAVYEEAVSIMDLGEGIAKEADCDRVREAIIASFDRYQKEMVQVGNGYYLMVNQRSMDAAYDAGEIAMCKLGMATPDSWTLENTKYIWQVVESGEPGKFYLRNWGTGKYMGQAPGTSKPHPMIADSTVKFTAPQFQGVWFRLHDGAAFAHNDAGGTIVHWNSTGEGNRWRFDPVPADTIDSLSVLVNQRQMTAKLSRLLEQVNDDIMGLQYENGLTFNGIYTSRGKGLVTEFEAANATETLEGSPEEAFDGKLDTYYHTSWHAESAPKDDWHWVQVDLGKQVKELYVKFSYRHNNNNGNPSRYAFVAAENDELEATQWLDTLAKDTAIYAYSTAYPAGVKDSTTCIQKVTFSRPAQHVRFVVTRTHANSIYGYGPCWHVSEIRFYDAADCVENPMYSMVPQNIKDELNKLIEKAKAEVDSNEATQETYDALVKALDEFWDAYPDPSALIDNLKVAKERAEAAEVGDELGYFEVGAPEGLLTVVAEIEAEIEANTLTLAQIEANQKKLDEAIKVFNSKLHALTKGKVYRMSGHPLMNGEEEDATSNGCVCSLNADINDTPVWRYKIQDVNERFNTLWYVDKDEQGYTFRNLANGYYIGNPYEGLSEEEMEDLEFDGVGYSSTPKHFVLEAGSEPGTLVAAMKDGQYLNLSPSGKLVGWWSRADHSVFDFTEVDPEDFSSSWVIDVPKDAATIVALPFEVATACTNGYTAMKATGILDGKIQFVQYDDDETIPAGTPFLVSTVVEKENEETEVEAENFFTAFLLNEEMDDNTNLVYNYLPVEQNGMISTSCAFELEPGYGYIYKDKVLVSEGGEEIGAGRGFFNKNIPAVEEVGDYSLELDGTLSGEGTGVSNLHVVKNVPTDVYTVSGMLIRHNVKTAKATVGLPKGVYIVGGKKVIVK